MSFWQLFLKKLAILGLVWLMIPAKADVLSTFAIRPDIYMPHPNRQLSDTDIALRLGWVSDPKVNNLCHGYYIEPILSYEDHVSLPPDKRPLRISFEESEFAPEGVSVFSGKVVITQPGRQLLADITHLRHEELTNAFTSADLFGHIEWREPGKHLIGERGHIEFDNNRGYLMDVLYRLTYTPMDEAYLGLIADRQAQVVDTLSGWGKAKQLYRDEKGVIEVLNASYTACPPTNNTWRLKAQQFTLDTPRGVGKARDVTLYVHDFPLLYLPYFQFPLDKQRKTGFLFPSFGITQTGGYELALPFYWNLAPNIDATITPNDMSERGLQWNGELRYLTNQSEGNLHGAILPHDREFSNFKQHNLIKYAQDTARRNRLQNEGTTRYFLSYKDNHHYTSNWSSYLYLNHVSDDYYFVDFKDDAAQITENQIINEAQLNYLGEHWTFATNLLAYQTLHPINQAPVNNQYQKVPEIVINGYFPDVFENAILRLNHSAVYFNKDKNPIEKIQPVIGSRFEINPMINFPLHSELGYFDPQIQLLMTQYYLSHQQKNNQASISRVLPIIDIDMGMTLNRYLKWNDVPYLQTLEPRFFYLYVPTRNQDEIPLFDTSLQPFTYSQLFRTNRFTGVDRISDANQLTGALTSRFLTALTGEEKLRMAIGEIFYFKDRQVNFKPKFGSDIVTRVITLPTDTRVSPLVGEVDVHLLPDWKLYSLAAWDPNTNITNNASLALQYKLDSKHLLNLGVNYIRGGDPEKYADPLSNRNDLYQPAISLVWPLNRRVTGLGYWNYNVSHGYTQTVFAGLQYESCCWALRIIGGREFLYQKVSLGGTATPVFDSQVFFELVFKGLGKLSHESPEKLLSDNIAGFEDTLAPFHG